MQLDLAEALAVPVPGYDEVPQFLLDGLVRVVVQKRRVVRSTVGRHREDVGRVQVFEAVQVVWADADDRVLVIIYFFVSTREREKG